MSTDSIKPQEEHPARPIGQILETMESSGPGLIMANSQRSKPSVNALAERMAQANPQQKRDWLDGRLGLKHHHKDLLALEEAIWKFCCDFAASPGGRGRRLVIFGNNGTGKTKTMRAVRRWVSDRAIDMPLVYDYEGMRTPDCIMVHWPTRVDAMKNGEWDIEDLMACSLLILDDIGAEHDPSKAGAQKLYLLLDRREFKWTIITTNIGPEHWERRFERRISDRLFRNCEHVDLSRVPSYSINT